MDREEINEIQTEEKKQTPKEKFISGLQETIETVVFVLVMVIIIRFFIALTMMVLIHQWTLI